MAEFIMDDDQKQIRETIQRFAQNEFREIARECDEENDLPSDLLDKVWKLDFCSNIIPEKYRGHGMSRSVLNSLIMAEEFAWGDVSLTIGSLSPLLMMIPLLEFGTEEQKEELLSRFCSDKFFPATVAMMEPRITFSPFTLHTTVDISNDTMIINGTKCMVPLADRAEHVLVYATTAKGSGTASVEAIIVDKDTPGMIVGEREKNMGFRPLPLYPVVFKDCEVPWSKRLGGDRGIDYTRIINLSRANFCSMAVGVARASYAYALNYAKERHAFGEPIASRQAVAFMLAEAAMEIEAMRLLAWRAAWRLDRQEDATRDSTLAKMYCADQIMKITDYGVQILGGHGYIRDHPVEMWFRNGRGFATMEGLAIG